MTDYATFDYEPLVDDSANNPLRLSIAEGMKVNPDQKAKALDLSKQTGLPVATVEDDVNYADYQSRYKNFNYQALTPKTQAFLSDYNNASIAHDDADNLTKVEKALDEQTYWESLQNAWTKGGAVVDVGNLAYKRAIANLAETNPLSPEEEAQLIQAEKNLGIPVSEYGLIQGIPVVASEQLPILWEIGKGSLLSGGVGAAIGGAVGGLLTRSGAGVSFGARTGFSTGSKWGAFFEAMQLEGGNAASEYRREGIDPVAADSAGVTVGIINGALELLSLRALGKAFVGDKKLIKDGIKKALSDPTKAQRMAEIGKRYARAVATESVTEFVQELVTASGSELAKYLDKDNFNDASIEKIITAFIEPENLSQAADASVKAAQASIAFGGVGTAINVTLEAKRKDTQAQIDQQKIDTIAENASESKLKERSPETFKQFVEEAAPGQNVFIDGPEAAEYLKNFTEEQIVSDPVLSRINLQAQEAREQNSVIQVPISDFATHIVGSEHYDALRQHMTLNEEIVSPARAKVKAEQDQAYIKTLVAQAEKNTEKYEEAKEFQSFIEDTLLKTGRIDKRMTKYEADITAAYYAVKADEMGISIQQAYEDLGGLEIQGPYEQRKQAIKEGAILDEQDFGDITFEEEATRKSTGEKMTVQRKAQDVFNEKVQQRNLAQKLLDCINGID